MSVEITIWFFLSSGLFLGWSLGANNAVTMFGTAVTSKMVKLRTAGIIAGIFVVIGSLISGAGTTNTLTSLGGINAIAGSFTVALSVGLSLTWMTRAKLPVSASQAVVGAIIGWNIFTGSPTDLKALSKILSSWVVSPVIAGVFGFILFKIVKNTVLKWKIHMLEIDTYTRTGLIIVGSIASYSMGANNIANVMGMFADANPFGEINVFDVYTLSGLQILFLIGGLSIAVGIITYGSKTMKTVGNDLYKISPITGLVIVLAEATVMWLFTSQSLEKFLMERNLPTIPLVPLSATQSFIGAVIGVGLAKDPQSINFKVFGKISLGWITAPLSAGILSFIMLFFVQNVFEQKVIIPVPYQLTASVIEKLESDKFNTAAITDLTGKRFNSKKEFRNELFSRREFMNQELVAIFNYAIIDSFRVDSTLIDDRFKQNHFTEAEINELKKLHGNEFSHKIDLQKALFTSIASWQKNGNALHDKQFKVKTLLLENTFRISSEKSNKYNSEFHKQTQH